MLRDLFAGVLLFVVGCGLAAERSSSNESGLRGPDPGEPFAGLSPELNALFFAGEDLFVREMSPVEGLGPIFIERSCVACHAQGGIGGADSLEDPNHLVQRFGTLNADGSYNNLATFGGDVMQTRSISADVPSCVVEPEQIPAAATIHASRNPLPMFGIGLIAAIPDATILAGAIDKGDGVHGRPNLAPNGRPGRFGWKAQNETLEPFNGAAANGTMGLTSPFAAAEQRPQGLATPAGCTNAELGALSPNDHDGSIIRTITAWEVLLAPVEPKSIHGSAARGAQIFEDIGCAKCHTPSMQSGDFDLVLPDGSSRRIEAVSNQSVSLYSDLLLHDMGPAMNEQVTMRQARGSEFRTAPLWGLRLRTRYLHDGRATTLEQAIEAHGGEAEIIRDRYLGLSREDRHELHKLLDRL